MPTMLARLWGFEPKTYGLEGRCSIQLSYRRIIISSAHRRRVLPDKMPATSRKIDYILNGYGCQGKFRHPSKRLCAWEPFAPDFFFQYRLVSAKI